MNRPIIAIALLLATTACSNYDFARARLPGGGYDLQKLQDDLKRSGNTQLQEGTWIPLIYTNLITFGAPDHGMPKGFKLQELTGIGPIFVGGGVETTHIDEQGRMVEFVDRNWLGWGLLASKKSRIETPHGARIEDRGGLFTLPFLFFGWRDLRYDASATGTAATGKDTQNDK